MTRLAVIAALLWSVALSMAGYAFGVHVQSIEDQVKQAEERDKEVAQVQAKSVKSVAAGIRVERAQTQTDDFFQHLRADYEADKKTDPDIGCVLDPVSLRRWNAANAQSDGDPASEPVDAVPQPADAETGPGRGEQPH